MTRPADEAAVVRALRHPTYDPIYKLTINHLIDDGIEEDICDWLAQDARALRALLRRAKELGTPIHWSDER